MRQTKRWLLPLVMALVGLTSGAFAQSSAYSFSTSSGTLDTLVGGVHVPNLEGDTRTSSPIDIGFDFEFNGVMYDTIIAMSDGFISFNTSATSTATNDLDNTTASRYPLIAPLWDDLDGRAFGSDTSTASYLTSGTAPNRVFTFEWKRWEWRYNSDSSVVTFQVKLYETSNVIEFYYKDEGDAPVSPSASIGIADAASFLSLTSIATPTVSNTSETTSLDSVPDGTVYAFTPPSCIAPNNLSVVSVGSDSAKINWGFVGTGTQFAYINITSGTTPSGQGSVISADSVTISGLMGNTDYDFYVREICAVGDSSAWVGPLSYTTACSPFTVPYFEGFESITSVGFGVIPDCWLETGDWATADAPATFNRQPRTGSNYLTTRWTATDVIYTAPITLNAGISYDFSYYYSTDGNTGWDSINIYAGSAQDINTMSSIGSTIYDPVNTNYIEDINTFIPQSTGTYYFAIRVKANGDPWYVSFDDISVVVTPTCPAPSNITLEAIAVDSARLAWDFVNAGTQFAYINVTSGTTPSGQGSVITADSVTVSGLMSNTAYDFYVREICAPGDSSLWVGPFAYTTVATCAEPINLGITNYTLDSVTIEWAADSNNTGMQFSYFVDVSGTMPNGQGTVITDDSITFTSLTPYVQNDFYIREICGAGDTSDWVGPITFALFPDAAPTLSCGSGFSSVIFAEEFDNNNAGWTGNIGNSDGDWEIPDASGSSNTGADIAFSGNSYMNYEASATVLDTGSVVSPIIDLSTVQTAAQLSFWMHAYGSDMGTLTVGVGTSATGPFTTEYTWTGQLQTSGSDPWVNVVVDLSAYVGQQIYIELKQADNVSFEGDMSIDLFEVRGCVTCPAPENLNAFNATGSTIDLAWSSPANGTNFEYELVPAGSSFTGSGMMATNDTVTATVTPNTLYDFYVREVCGAGDTSTWVGPLSFASIRTATGVSCGTNFSQAILIEEFDNNNAGWTGDIGTSNGDWEIPEGSSGNTGADNAFSGSEFMSFESSGTSLDTGSIVSPMIDLTSGVSQAELSFWMHAYGADMGELHVGVGTSATGPFTNVFSWIGELQTNGAAPWQNVGVDLTAYVGQQIYIELQQIDSTGALGDMSIDLFEVTTCVSCPDPINVVASNITNNSAEIDWASAATGANFAYINVTSGTAPSGQGTIITTDSVALSSLTGNTAYDFYVREVCGAGDSSNWVGPITYTTDCNAFTVPYFEGFETMTSVGTGIVPECWLEDGDWGTEDSPASNNRQPRTGTNYLFTNWSATDVVYTAPISLTAGISYDFTYYYSTDGNNGWDSLNAYVGLAQDVTMMTSIGTTIYDPLNTSYIQSTNTFIPSTTGVYYFAVRVKATSAPWYISFDDFAVNLTPTCPAPSNVTLEAVGIDSAKFSWDFANAGTQFAYQNVISGTSPTGQGIVITADSVTVTSLMADTDYDFYVREICTAGDSSFWIGPLSYSTLCNAIVAPYTENFDGSEWTNGTGFDNTGDAISDCWFRNPSSDFFWGTRSGATGSSGTGPNADNTTGSGNYIFVEASNGSNGDTAVIETPLIDFSGLANPHLSFAYHMFGGDIDKLYIYAKQGVAITLIDSIVGEQQTANNDPWMNRIIDVSAFTSANTQFGWYLIKTGIANPTGGFAADVAIDDVEVLNIEQDDLGVTAFIPPASFCGDSNTIIQVVVQNFGIQDQDGFDVTVDWTGSTTGSVTVTYNDTLAYGEFDTINVDTLNTVLGGTFNLAGYTTLTGDGNINNDTTLAPGVTFFALPVVDLGAAQTFCDNVNFSATLDAGNAGSTFLWSDGSMNQTLAVTTGDTYWVEVTDVNGCIASDTVIYTELASAVVDLGVDLTYCEGATFIDTLDAGNAGSTYLWSDGSMNQELPIDSAGTYWVEVTNANNCVSTDTLEVTEEAAPMVSVANDTVCDGETATLDAGAGFTSYNWNTMATTQTIDVMTAGTYTVTVTNAAGCTAEDSAEVVINALPVVVLTGDTVCEGETVTLDAGAGFASYNWSSGPTTQTIDVSMAGTYTVTVTNAEGCEASDSATVGFNANPVVDLGADTGLAPTQSIVLDAGNDGSTYSWSTGVTDQTVTITYADVPTTVSVEVTNAEGCTGVDTIFIDRFVGISEVVQGGINLYPNPVANDVHIAFTAKQAGAVNIKVFDVSGQLVDIINQDINTGLVDVSWSMSTLESGVYFIQATLNNKDLGQFRVVKQ